MDVRQINYFQIPPPVYWAFPFLDEENIDQHLLESKGRIVRRSETGGISEEGAATRLPGIGER